MTKKNIEGPVHALLTDVNKMQCEYCNGTKFQVGDLGDENTDFPTDSRIYAMENVAGFDKIAIPFLCQCGKVSGKLLYTYDVCTARGASSFTGTNLDAAVANIFKGSFLIVLGGTDKDKWFPITANTVASPTVLTVTGTPNIDAIGEGFIISDFKSFTAGA